MGYRSGLSKAVAAAIAAVVIVAAISGCVSYYISIKPPKTVTLTKTATVTVVSTASTSSTTVTSTLIKKVTVTVTHTLTITKTAPTLRSRVSRQSTAIVVTDLAGRRVTLKHIAERIVVLQTYWAEVVTALGKANTIVGVGSWVPYDQYLPKYVRDKPTVGSLFKGVNIEEIAALKPDVVITDYGYGKAKELISRLESLGIPVICLFIHGINDEIRAIKILGKVLGAEERAQKLISFIESRWSLIKSKATSIPNGRRLRVVMISGFALLHGGQILLYSNTSWGHSITDVGAINLALKHFPNKDWPRIDFETLLKWDPDAIIVTASPNWIQKVLDYIQSNIKWHALKAFKDGRIYAVPCWSSVGGVLDWGPRDIIGREYIAKLLYPKVYEGINWRRDMEYLLTHFYGVFIPEQAFASYSIRWKKIVDLSGHVITLPRKVNRVVDLLCYQLDLALGVMNRLVGISKFAKFNPVLMKAYPNVTKIPSPGSSFSLNIEEVASLKPQLVILFPFMSANPSYVKQLRKLGIAVLPVWLFSFKDIERLIWLLGTIYDVRARAAKIVSDMNSIIKLIESRVSGIPMSKRVRVLYLWGEPTTVQGGHGTVNDFIRLAGGINVAANAFPNRDYVRVNLEQIIKWDPQMIVIWWWARYGPSKILKDPRWSAITAVKKGLVFKEPYYEHWGPDAAIFILWLAMKMYPNRFKGLSFSEIANKYFEEWYGIPYTAIMRGLTH